MSSQYFGFEDEATPSTSCIAESSPCPPKVAPKKVNPVSQTEQLSISQIQALLCQDLTSLDSSLNVSTNETSFYTDEQDTQTTDTLTETVAEDYYGDETSSIIEEKFERRPRKVLGNIVNSSEVKSCKTYKKPANAKAKAGNSFVRKEEKLAAVKPAKKRKAKKENTENDENFDKFAELINKQFAQVENFQLHVE